MAKKRFNTYFITPRPAFYCTAPPLFATNCLCRGVAGLLTALPRAPRAARRLKGERGCAPGGVTIFQPRAAAAHSRSNTLAHSHLQTSAERRGETGRIEAQNGRRCEAVPAVRPSKTARPGLPTSFCKHLRRLIRPPPSLLRLAASMAAGLAQGRTRLTARNATAGKAKPQRVFFTPKRCCIQRKSVSLHKASCTRENESELSFRRRHCLYDQVTDKRKEDEQKKNSNATSRSPSEARDKQNGIKITTHARMAAGGHAATSFTTTPKNRLK